MSAMNIIGNIVLCLIFLLAIIVGMQSVIPGIYLVLIAIFIQLNMIYWKLK